MDVRIYLAGLALQFAVLFAILYTSTSIVPIILAGVVR